MQVAEPRPEERAAIGPAGPRRTDRGGDRQRQPRLCRTVGAARASCWCRAGSRCCASSPSCRLSPRQAVAVLVGERRQRREPGDRPAAGRHRPSALDRGRQLSSAPAWRPDVVRSAARHRGRDTRRPRGARPARAARWSSAASRSGREAARAGRDDRARPGQSDRRSGARPTSSASANCSTSSRARRRSPGCSTRRAGAAMKIFIGSRE